MALPIKIVGMDYKKSSYIDDDNFSVGDICSRDGTDEHLVIDVDIEWGQITVLCIKEPQGGWIKVGETEINLSTRYTFIEKCINYQIYIENYKKEVGLR